MPDYDNPVRSAQEAAEAARALAHATRAFGDRLADSYDVVTELLSTACRLEQVLDQVSSVHRDACDKARGENDSPATGRRHALAAAAELRQAARLLGQVEAHLDVAAQHSGAIRWPERIEPSREGASVPASRRDPQEPVSLEEAFRRVSRRPDGPGHSL
ncbi:hypothetical protein [Georgenia thermotolerans]|uniref:Uncharacterized protein n=1 Tax=Georgenia thermotolerans TaxID=527326 RepID=A0A7J5UMV1_9MICO|nr:hypothetical protein [Georgenia thermotolerans]KAE8763434.1 hypothetical protein GB883_14225 [Georgenia thermotolerans]